MLEIGIESSTLELIRQGRKTIEGRLGKPKFLKIHPGDRLVVREDIWDAGLIKESHQSDVTLLVKQVLYFESFREMLESLGFEDIVPLANNLEEAMEKYSSFYSAQDEEEYGAVAILFALQ